MKFFFLLDDMNDCHTKLRHFQIASETSSNKHEETNQGLSNGRLVGDYLTDGHVDAGLPVFPLPRRIHFPRVSIDYGLRRVPQDQRNQNHHRHCRTGRQKHAPFTFIHRRLQPSTRNPFLPENFNTKNSKTPFQKHLPYINKYFNKNTLQIYQNKIINRFKNKIKNKWRLILNSNKSAPSQKQKKSNMEKITNKHR